MSSQILIDMKKLWIVFLFVACTFQAQKKEDVYKKLAQLTCDCASKKDVNSLTELDLGLCIFSSLDQISDKEKKAIDYNPDQKTDISDEMAEKVGIEMLITCPDVISAIAKRSSLDEAEEEVEETDIVSTKGTYVSQTANEFITIELLNEANQKENFIWLFPFSGDTLLIKNKIDKGDKLEVFYREQQFYDAKTRAYVVYKEIVEIRML